MAGRPAIMQSPSEFKRIVREHGPDSAVAFYVSGQLLTEDYYVANKLMKGFIGSANIDTNSRLCMSSAVAGHKRAFGADSVPASYDDFAHAELMVLVGSNTAWCHPIIFQRIKAIKAERPDLKIVVIDPRETATLEIADLHLPVKPGGDVLLFNALLAELAERGAVDKPLHRRIATVWRPPWPRPWQRSRRPDDAGGTAGHSRRPAGHFLPLVYRHRAHADAVFDGRQPVQRRDGQGQRHHQLPPGDRPHRQARRGPVLADRPAQRHGRAGSGRLANASGGAHGAMKIRCIASACSASGSRHQYRNSPA
jgi:hypothetical protein